MASDIGKLLLGALFMMIVITPMASSLGIAPAIVKIENGQGFEHTYDYYVRGGSKAGDVAIVVSCNKVKELEQFITTEVDKIYFSHGEIHHFDVHVNIPSNFSIPGYHMCTIGASEVPPETGTSTMSAYSGISGQIYIRIPYPEKYIEATLEAPDVNKSMPVPFTISLASRGLENVLAQGTITINDASGKEIARLYTQQILVESLKSGVLNAQWDSTGNPAGIYRAEAEIEYGAEKPAVAEKVFRIGEVFIDVLNVTQPEIMEPDKILKFNIWLQSMWNDEIQDVNLELQAFRDGAAVGAPYKSESFDMKRWQTKNVLSYWDTEGLDEGEYQLRFTVHYSGKTSEKTINVELRRSYNMLLWLIVLAVALIVAIAGFLLRRKKRKGETGL